MRNLNGAEVLSIKRLIVKGDSDSEIAERHSIDQQRVHYFRKLHQEGKFEVNEKEVSND
ncbi:hypothetical protein [Taibaiella lutea]|uniref:hypothetical protein n=1 Tax=Taibaiella lutea TaxID=2608001 RepID=UPI00167FE17D|nr:hypothetical protein [Taibaiella lutea]